jgi:hypothetical protein
VSPALVVLGGLGAIVTAAALVWSSVMIWRRPELVVIALLALVCFLDWSTEELGLLPHAATALIELAIVWLAAVAFVRRGWRPRLPSATGAILLLAFLGVVSALVNVVPLTTAVLGMRPIFKYVIFFLALLNLPLDEAAWRRVLAAAAVLMLVQVPIAFAEWLVFGKRDDQVFGSLRSTGVLTLLSVFFLAVIAALFLRARGRWWYIVVAAPYFVLPVIGETKAFFLLLPLALAVVGWREVVRRPLPVMVAGGALLLGVVAAISLFNRVEGNARLTEFLNRPGDILQSALMPTPEISRVGTEADVTLSASTRPRLDAIEGALRAIARSPATLLVGYGPGSRRLDSDTASRPDTAPIATKLYEFGALGTAVYWVVLWLACRPARALRRDADGVWRSLSLAMPAVLAVYLIGDFYTDTLYDPAAAGFWLLAAATSARAWCAPAVRVRASGWIHSQLRGEA